MRVLPIASSSKANAYLVEHEDAIILIDCGLSCKELKARLKAQTGEAGVCDKISAILITHSHSDHVAGLPVFLKHYDVPIYANFMTAESIIAEYKVPEESFVCFENGQRFPIGPFEIQPFSIPHDTADPVGYLVSAGEKKYFHATDIGTPLDSIGVKLAEADIATIESNHDPVLLRASGRPPSLIQRIAGPRGHLSNDDAAELVMKFASSRLRQINLAHLSQDCNAPHIAERTMKEALNSIGREDVGVVVLSP